MSGRPAPAETPEHQTHRAAVPLIFNALLRQASMVSTPHFYRPQLTTILMGYGARVPGTIYRLILITSWQIASVSLISAWQQAI